MLFSSPIFLFVFLPLIIIASRLIKESFQIYFLFFASLLFYASGEPANVLLILCSITANYTFGMLLNAKSTGVLSRKTILLFSIFCNITVLFYFKYLNFASSILYRIIDIEFIAYDIALPIGISFFTFQGMSYVIDVYWNKIEPQSNPIAVAFYISFFPQLIAGPIVRYIDIEKQIFSRSETIDDFSRGAARFISGLSKKVIIANTLGYTADQIFSNSADENAVATAWLGAICYSFQIYFDFSGYSDMAIGLGRMFGFKFLENFNYPYLACGISDFWRRWHISLSSWFRDYVYIPLGGNRTGSVHAHLFIVFALTGLWHGASFNFLAWGVWHGFFLMTERTLGLKDKAKNNGHIFLRWLLTMLVVVCGWVLFRSDNMPYALRYLGVMFSLIQPRNLGYTVWYYLDTKIIGMLVVALLASMPILGSTFIRSLRKYSFFNMISLAVILLLFCVSVIFVTASSYNPFIYFRF